MPTGTGFPSKVAFQSISMVQPCISHVAPLIPVIFPAAIWRSELERNVPKSLCRLDGGAPNRHPLTSTVRRGAVKRNRQRNWENPSSQHWRQHPSPLKVQAIQTSIIWINLILRDSYFENMLLNVNIWNCYYYLLLLYICHIIWWLVMYCNIASIFHPILAMSIFEIWIVSFQFKHCPGKVRILARRLPSDQWSVRVAPGKRSKAHVTS